MSAPLSSYGQRLRAIANTPPTPPPPTTAPATRSPSRWTHSGRIDREETTTLRVAAGTRAATALGIAMPYLSAGMLGIQAPSVTGALTALLIPLIGPLLLLLLLAFLTRRPWWFLRGTARASWAIGSRIPARPDHPGRALLVHEPGRTRRVHLARDIATPVGATITVTGPTLAGTTRAWFYRVDGIDTRTRTCRGVPLALTAVLLGALATLSTLFTGLA